MEGRLLLWRDAIRGRNRHNEERIHSGAGTQAIVPADEFAERTDAKLREPIADFLGKRTEVGDHHLGLTLKSGAQLFVLGGDAHRASVEVALPRHDASDGEERSGAKSEFVRAKDSGEHDIACKFQAPVHAEREA